MSIKAISAATLITLALTAGAVPVTTAFTYQGRLNRNNGPANGTFDLMFELYAVATGGTRIGQPVEVLSQQISGGLFTVELNFGGPAVFDGTAYWLATSARPANGGNYTPTPGRVAIRPTPYAIQALSAATVQDGSVTTSSLANGAVTGSKLASSAVGLSQLNAAGAPASGQVLAYNGTGLSWITPPGGGGGSGPWQLSGLNAYYNNGNVGIGTNAPASKLDVRGVLTLEAGGDAAIYTGTGSAELNRYIGILNSPDFQSASGLKTGGLLVSDSFFYANPGKNDVVVKGKVGIGTTAPVAPLEINGSWDATGIGHVRLTGNKPTIEWRKSEDDGLAGKTTWLAHIGPSSGMEFWHRYTSIFGIDTGWLMQAAIATNGDFQYAGRLGKLETADNFAATVRSADLFLGHSSRRGTPGRALVDLGTKLVVNFAGDWSETVIGGNVAEVKTLRITGGADLAEPFAMSHDGLEPGSVVVIDEKNPGKLRRSTDAYDKKVAGIVSGANGIKPGISMIQEDKLEAGENVSLSGRVYVKADNSAGSIEPGDLLTTSSTPGRAMRAADHDKAQGAILGKAMTSLADGDGMVLVLVTLQ